VLISRRLILQQARGHSFNRAPTACKLTVSCSISLPSRGSFHLSLAVLFSIGHTVVFSLTRWSWLIQSGFLVPRPTRDSAGPSRLSTTGLSPPMVQLSTDSSSLLDAVLLSHDPGVHALRFRLFPFRSPLLWKSLLFSLPTATKMFQFAALALSTLFYSGSSFKGCPIRISPDHRSLPAPRDVSSVTTSFFASVCLGIHREPFVA
jgi:hypothetical protein